MSNDLTLLNIIFNDYCEELGENYREDDAFELFVVDNYLKKYDLSYEELEVGLIGGSIDWGIDGFYIIIDDTLISNIEDFYDMNINRNDTVYAYIFQFKNSKKIQESVLEKFITITPHLTNLESNLDGVDKDKVFSEELVEKLKLFHEILKKSATKYINVKVNYIHATKGDSKSVVNEERQNNAYLQKVEDLKNIYKNINLGAKTEFKFTLLGATELKDLSAEEKCYTSTLRINENNIFVEYDDGNVENNQRGYIVTAKLNDYFNFLTEKKEDSLVLKRYLFDSNIRDFQNKTEVNKDIEKTLTGKEQKQDFWWLNNGITILADEGSIIGRDFSMDNIKIVNGLQTSHSIYHAFKDLTPEERKKDNRTIFCKIIITNDTETIDNIIKATNSQNPISSALLRATDQIQRDIELYLLKYNLYYDRRKNYYKNQKKPRNKIISMNYLSQSLKSVLFSQPSKARNNPTILTKKDEDYQELYNKDYDIKVYYNVILLRKETEDYLKNNFTIKDEIDESIKNYYYLHLTRILASIVCNISNVNHHLLKDEDKFQNISDDDKDKSIEILKEILVKKGDDKSGFNFEKYAKNSEIDKLINKKLDDYLPIVL